MKHLIALSMILTILLAGGVRCAENLTILGNARQGGVLYITLSSIPDTAQATAKMLDSTEDAGAVYTFAPGVSGHSVPIAISANEKPGVKRLSVTVKLSSTEKRTISRRITVKRYAFRKEHLTMSRSNAARYSDPAAEEESRRCRKARDEYINRQLWRKAFIMPCSGAPGTRFGVRRYVNGVDMDYHAGQDIRAAMGEAVRSSNDGIVALTAEKFLLRGKTIIINHGQGLTTQYLHLSKIAVKKGQSVVRGQIIGYAGSTGASTGPHLHWAAYCGRIPFDPLLLLNPPGTWLER